MLDKANFLFISNNYAIFCDWLLVLHLKINGIMVLRFVHLSWIYSTQCLQELSILSSLELYIKDSSGYWTLKLCSLAPLYSPSCISLWIIYYFHITLNKIYNVQLKVLQSICWFICIFWKQPRLRLCVY